MIRLIDAIRNLNKRIINWVDELRFTHILALWASIIICFGAIYYFFNNDKSALFDVPKKAAISNIKDSIYFSFVASTTTGFGDIVPTGSFKVIVIFEVILGLMLLAMVTSKLVSIKQDKIMTELYDISFHEKVNRIRSSLLLFRQNIDRLLIKIEESRGNIQRREINSVYMYITSLKDTLTEINNTLLKSKTDQFIKNLNPIDTELIFISILNSFEKLIEFIHVKDQKNIGWNNELNAGMIKQCMNITESLFNIMNSSTSLMSESIQDLNSRKKNLMSVLNELNNAQVNPITLLDKPL